MNAVRPKTAIISRSPLCFSVMGLWFSLIFFKAVKDLRTTALLLSVNPLSAGVHGLTRRAVGGGLNIAPPKLANQQS